MTKQNPYLKSVALQFACSATIIASLVLIVVPYDARFLHNIAYVSKESYMQLPYSLVYAMLKSSMTPELHAVCRDCGFILRIIISLLIALFSIRFKIRYALILEVIITLFSIFLFVIVSLRGM